MIKLYCMLDVRRMQVLRAVVSSGSVTAAAARLGYTPSAISQQVAALEREAGTALLERVGRGVRPTAAGLLLTEYADAISRQVSEAETALADLRDGQTGRLSVRYFATAGSALVAPAVARLRRPVEERRNAERVSHALAATESSALRRSSTLWKSRPSMWSWR